MILRWWVAALCIFSAYLAQSLGYNDLHSVFNMNGWSLLFPYKGLRFSPVYGSHLSLRWA